MPEVNPIENIYQGSHKRWVTDAGVTEQNASIPVMELPFEDELKQYVRADEKLFDEWIDKIKNLWDIVLSLQATKTQLLLNPSLYNDAYLSSLLTSLVNKILDNIDDGGSGLPAAVEESIYERARQRAIFQANRQVRRIVTDIAKRLPYAGQIADLLIEADRDVAMQLNEINLSIMVKQAELAYQNQRDKIKEAIEMEKINIAAFEQKRDRSLRAYVEYDKAQIHDNWKYFEFQVNKVTDLTKVLGNELLQLMARGADQITFENWLAMSKIMAEGQLRIAALVAQLMPDV